MRVIDAYWDSEMFGEQTLEIVIEDIDRKYSNQEIIEKIENLCFENKSEYIVIKLKDNKRPYLARLLQLNNFYFSESQFELKFVVKENIKLIEKIEKLTSNGRLEKIRNKDQLRTILDSVGEDMFDTDRIALDPAFGKIIANKRYKNWIQQEYIYGSDVFITQVDELPVGFSIMKTIRGKTRYSLLGGVFPDYKKQGYALYNAGLPLIYERNLGTEIVKTSVSSNNFKMLKLDDFLGLRVVGMTTVFIKHIKK